MSAFDRLQNYSASNKSMTSDIFDVNTPEGCFLAKLHSQGYLMYEYYYEDSTLGRELSENEYSWLTDEEKKDFTKKMRFTELHDMLTTAGDQLVLANAGSGKALVNSTKVITPQGYIPISDLKVGDKVFGTDLKEHNVLGVYPQGKKRVNEMTIESDNSRFTVSCCDEHLWAIKNKTGFEIISTKDIKRKLKTLNSLALVVPSPFEFDIRGNAEISETSKATIFYRVLYRMLNLRDTIRNTGTDSVFNITLLGYDKNILDYLYNLQTYVKNDLVSLKPIDDNSCCLSLEASFYISTLCKIDNFNDYLTNFLVTGTFDCLKIFNGKDCAFRIVSVEEREAEVDMTCIEVSSDNHLFLIEHLIPTHNTTALIFKIMHDIITGEATKVTSIPNGNSVRIVDDIFVGTFLKSGADELAERLAYWQRGMGYTVTADRVNFSTLHAEFKRALNTMGAATPIGKAQDINKCLKKAVDGLGITRDGSALTQEDYNVIGGIVTYYRGRLDSNKYNHPSALDYGLTPTLLDRLVSDFANQRQLSGIMDFEDLQELLYKFLYVQPNKAVQDFCANRYKYIYLDEFQDTSQIQYAIIKFYARGRLWMNRGTSTPEEESSPLFSGCETLGKIIAVGDPDQCIIADTPIRMADINSGDFRDDEVTPNMKKDSVMIQDLHKGDYVYSPTTRYTKVLEEPISHELKDVDLVRLTVEDNMGETMSIECTKEHIFYKESPLNKIPEEHFSRLTQGFEGQRCTQTGWFDSEVYKSIQGYMTYAKDICIGDSLVYEYLGGNSNWAWVIKKEIVHYDKVTVWDIHTESTCFSANNFIAHNCIYAWRGSDNKIIEHDFEADFKPCLTKLSYNYRCPSNILNAVVPSIKVNEGHEKREYHSSREGGIAKGYHFTSYNSMLNQLIADIDEDMNEGNTVAVLCRTNYDGVIPAFILEANKQYDFSINGQNMTFDSPLPRKLVAVTSIFTERSSPAVKNTLSMFVSRYSQWTVKQLVDTLKTNGKSVWQLPHADIEYSCNELAGIIKDIKSIFYENGKRVPSKEMEALKFVYNWIRVNTFGGDSLYCESARAYIESLLYIIESNKFESVFDFLDYVNTLNERLHARINNPRAKICIATVHEFKGKERDSIIVWNDSDGVFPSSKTNIENLSELEEERRVHYVACTRAKKKSKIYTIFGKEGLFTKEMNLQFESPHSLGGTLGSKTKKEDLSEDEANLLGLIESESK